MNLTDQVFNEENKPSEEEKKEVVDFLYDHLDEFGDEKEDIMKCVNFAVKDSESFGGFIFVQKEGTDIICAVIMNRTGMKGYIPENILVYIATHRDHRGKGVGKRAMQKVLAIAEGDVKLHVEPENPAKFLYEKLGFTNKYLEMRYKKN